MKDRLEIHPRRALHDSTLEESSSAMKSTPFFSNLKCRECGRLYPKQAIHVCDFDFGPLEAAYDYEAIGKAISRKVIESRPHTMWRYRELLPIDGDPTVGAEVGFTPLIKADRLAKILGIRELWIKNDTVNYPTLSFKDRVVSVALSRARELGFEVVACASTGNLANSVAANAAAAGLKSYVLIPADLEQGKVLGSLVYGTQVIGIHGAYDQVNRLCSEIAGKYGWGFVNVNLRPYYAEGSKTMGFEICEQLGWRIPQHTVVPMASGSLLTKIHKAYKEFIQLGIVADTPFHMHGTQASGCAPISHAIKRGTDIVKPVSKPDTIVKSLAIGTPADGYYAIHSMKQTGGSAEDVSDEEVVEGICMLAEYAGIFAETAGGVTVAGARKLIESGHIGAGDSAVLCITGHGLKTQEAIVGKCGAPRLIAPNLREFEEKIYAPDAAAASL